MAQFKGKGGRTGFHKAMVSAIANAQSKKQGGFRRLTPSAGGVSASGLGRIPNEPTTGSRPVKSPLPNTEYAGTPKPVKRTSAADASAGTQRTPLPNTARPGGAARRVVRRK